MKFFFMKVLFCFFEGFFFWTFFGWNIFLVKFLLGFGDTSPTLFVLSVRASGEARIAGKPNRGESEKEGELAQKRGRKESEDGGSHYYFFYWVFLSKVVSEGCSV